MSDPDHDFVEPNGRHSHDVVDEQFVHGLLESCRHDGPDVQRRRMARVMADLAGDRQDVLEPKQSRWRRVVAALTVAAAVAVVATFLAITDRRSAAEVVASLLEQPSVDARFDCWAESLAGKKVFGTWDFGGRGERLFELGTSADVSLKVLVLRAPDGSCHVRVKDRPAPRDAWPSWLRSGSMVAPLSTPWQLLQAMSESCTFAFEGEHIVAHRRLDIVDPLMPERCEIRFDQDREQLTSLVLKWSPTAVAKVAKEAPLKDVSAWFDGLDENQDGMIDGREVGEQRPRFESLGFDLDEPVDKSAFLKIMKPKLVRSAGIELLDAPVDLTKSQPPLRFTVKSVAVPSRPTWLFELEALRRR